MPLAVVRMSGWTPQCSMANHLPERPQPDMTSSAMRRTPVSSQMRRSFGHVFGGRDDDAVGAYDGLDDDGGDVGLVADHVLDVVGAGDVAAGIGVADGAAEAVDFGGEEGALLLAADGFHGPAAWIAGGGDGAGG